MNVILLGYRGSGKTTVGRLLAGALALKFVDLDEEIVLHAGKTIREIFADAGESAFRDIESACLQKCLGRDGYVISLGGGAILRPENREALLRQAAARVYLKADPAVLLSRIQGDATTAASRPALTALGGGMDEVRMLLSQREPHYRLVSTHEIDVTHLSPADVAAKIAELINSPRMGVSH